MKNKITEIKYQHLLNNLQIKTEKKTKKNDNKHIKKYIAQNLTELNKSTFKKVSF